MGAGAAAGRPTGAGAGCAAAAGTGAAWGAGAEACRDAVCCTGWGAEAAAGTMTATALFPCSSASIRSASASKVRSESGRTMRVRAISKHRRGLPAVFSCTIRSPSTPSMRDALSGPNSFSSDSSWVNSDPVTPRTAFEPAMATTYRLRTCSAMSRANCAKSAPESMYSATQAKQAATSRRPTASMMRAMSVDASEPSRSRAPSIVTLPPPKVISCSKVVRALRIPPSALCATSSRASSSNSASSAMQITRSLSTISPVPRRWKSKRWQREWMVAGTFCGSVVHSTKTTCEGGSSKVFSSALNAAVESMCTSSMM